MGGDKDTVASGLGLCDQWFWHVQVHRAQVQALMERVCGELKSAAAAHDLSKLTADEANKFSVLLPRLQNTTYGSDRYKQLLDELGPALAHHYKHNRHHPEHHDQGVDDMDLLDLLEMFVDWVAATRMHADGDILVSIKKNTQRFELSPQLARILTNTAKRLCASRADRRGVRNGTWTER